MIITKESTHWYTIEGEPRYGSTLRQARKEHLLPSVTSICRMWPAPALQNWILEQHVVAAITTPRLAGEPDADWIKRVLKSADEESDKARTTGSRRHDLLHDFHKNGNLNLATEDFPFIEPYIHWLRKHVSRIEDAEYVTVHRGLGYAGMVDVRCILSDGRRALLDIKNRKKIKVWESDIHQLVAYAKAEQHSGQGVDAVISIILGSEKPGIFVAEHIGVETAWEDFLTCLRIYQRSKNYKPKLNHGPTYPGEADEDSSSHSNTETGQCHNHIEQPGGILSNHPT